MALLFLDTEFTALSQQAKLLSLALVSEREEWFYAVFTDVETSGLSSWHQQNVVPFLDITPSTLSQLPKQGQIVKAEYYVVIKELKSWLQQFSDVKIWADVSAYDWVFFCELFGGALNLPSEIHYIVRDLATLFELKGLDADTDRFDFAYADLEAKNIKDLPRHNALGDAFGAKDCYHKLIAL